MVEKCVLGSHLQPVLGLCPKGVSSAFPQRCVWWKKKIYVACDQNKQNVLCVNTPRFVCSSKCCLLGWPGGRVNFSCRLSRVSCHLCGWGRTRGTTRSWLCVHAPVVSLALNWMLLLASNIDLVLASVGRSQGWEQSWSPARGHSEGGNEPKQGSGELPARELCSLLRERDDCRARRQEKKKWWLPPCSTFVGFCGHLGNGTGLKGGKDLVHVKSHSSSNKFILWLASACLEWGCNLTAVYKGSVRGLLGASSQLLSS